MVLESCPFVFLQNSRSELVKETKNNIIARQVNLVSIVVPVIPGIINPVNPRGTEILKGIRTQDDAKKIAAEQIKEEMVPPALPEVWKPMSESDFQNLKANRAGPCYIPVSHDEHLAPPSK